MTQADEPPAELRAVARARQRRRQLEEQEIEAVAAARVLDVTWWDIGVAIGMQQAAATRKFKPLVEAVDPEVEGLSQGRVLKELKRIRAAQVRAEAAEVEAVRAARDAGVPWQQIGDTLGMARSNVTTHFKPLLEGRAVRSRRSRPVAAPRRA